MVEANLFNFVLLPIFILLLLLLLIIIFLIIIIIMNKRRTKPNLPPSPPNSFPIVGHLFFLKQPLHETLYKLSKKFGPIMLLRFGIRRVVVVTCPSIVEECFTGSNDVVLANRPLFLSNKHISYDFTTLGMVSYGHLWRSLRRVCASEFLSTTRLDATTHSREHEVKLMCRQIYKESIFQEVVDLKSRFIGLLNNIVTMAVMGKRYYGDVIDIGDVESALRFREIIGELFEFIHTPKIGDFVPILRWLDFLGSGRNTFGLRKKIDEFLDEIIKKRRCIGRCGSGIMVDTLLALQDEEPELYTDEIIKGLILMILTAGTEPPYLVLEWTMSLLLKNTNALQKVKNEIETHVGSNRLLQESDLDKLSYLRKVINESIRLYPTLPLLIPHEASEDINIGGYFVPRGTMLMVNSWAIQRDPDLWDKPNAFMPERFEKNCDYKYKMLPFSVGRRGCPGTNFGYRILGLTLGTLIQAFEWDKIGNEEINMTASPGFSMSKLEPLQAICKPRSNMIVHLLQD